MDLASEAMPSDASDDDPVTDFLAAEEAVAQLARQYPQWASRELAQVRENFERLPGSDSPQLVMEEVREYAHTLKGQGGSFGYSLASDIAQSLQLFVDKVEVPTELQCRTIAVHLDALQVVFRRQLVGDGGEMGRTMLDRLRSTAEKTAA